MKGTCSDKKTTVSVFKDKEDILFAHMYGNVASFQETEMIGIEFAIYLRERDRQLLYPKRSMNKSEVAGEVDAWMPNRRNIFFLIQDLMLSKDEREMDT